MGRSGEESELDIDTASESETVSDTPQEGIGKGTKYADHIKEYLRQLTGSYPEELC